MSERDNRMVWDGRPLHYEAWFLTANHRPSGDGFWIRYVVESPRIGEGEPYAQLWFSRFSAHDPAATFGVTRKFPAVQLSAVADPFSLRIGDAIARHDGWAGGISVPAESGQAAHEVTWDLAWRPSFSTYRHFPDLFYRLPLTETLALSPNLDIAIRGAITVDGTRYDLDGEPGGQSHVWGRKHGYQWAWGHCNAFEGEPGAVLEALAGRIRRGQMILPTLTAFSLHLDGEEIAFRGPLTMPLARSDWGTGYFNLLGAKAESRVEVHMTCSPDDMLLAEYLDPDGDPAFNHITTLGDIEVNVKKRSPFFARWRDHKTLRARRMAHFEWGARAGDVMRVRKVVQHH